MNICSPAYPKHFAYDTKDFAMFYYASIRGGRIESCTLYVCLSVRPSFL